MKCFNELFSNMYIKQDNTKAFNHLITQTKMVPNVNLPVGPTKAHQQHLKLKNDNTNFLYCLQPT